MKNSTILCIAAAIWSLWYFWQELSTLAKDIGTPILAVVGTLSLFWEILTLCLRGTCLLYGWKPSEEPPPIDAVRYSVLYLIARGVRHFFKFIDNLPSF